MSWFGFVLLLLLLLVVALPNFVRSRGVSSVASADSVKVLTRQVVGIYDTTTLTSADGRALLHWLNRHGFHTPATALPVISDYSKQGWMFVAATINRDAPGIDSSRPHPLAFTFLSEKPVYPLRLTGVENTHCSIELFSAVQQYALERKHSGVLTDYELLPALNEYIKGGAKNTFVDKPLRCESTPGNITMRTSAGGVEVFWHDINNASRPLATFPITSK